MNKLQELVDDIHKMSGIGKITLTERIQTLLTSEVENTLNKITDAMNKKYPITFIEMKGGAEEGGYVVRGKQNSVDISRLSPDEYHMIDFIDSIISEQRKALSDIGGRNED